MPHRPVGIALGQLQPFVRAHAAAHDELGHFRGLAVALAGARVSQL